MDFSITHAQSLWQCLWAVASPRSCCSCMVLPSTTIVFVWCVFASNCPYSSILPLCMSIVCLSLHMGVPPSLIFVGYSTLHACSFTQVILLPFPLSLFIILALLTNMLMVTSAIWWYIDNACSLILHYGVLMNLSSRHFNTLT